MPRHIRLIFQRFLRTVPLDAKGLGPGRFTWRHFGVQKSSENTGDLSGFRRRTYRGPPALGCKITRFCLVPSDARPPNVNDLRLSLEDFFVRTLYARHSRQNSTEYGNKVTVARPKEFDRATALKAAIAVFSDHGYEGTSTDALLEAMGICRQSMYDTFGDKRRLYLDALQQYNADSIAEVIANLNMASSPLKGLEAAL